MKFIQVKIYGFGKWVDQTIDFPFTKPICFYGENESGKSTLQQFVLYVLFGLPPRKLARFKPIDSNKIGGILVVEDDTIGRYSIERIENDVICHIASGEQENEQWLQTRLKGLNRQIYTSIYAFSALDLTEIRQMKQEQLSDVLFSVGLTGSTNIYEAEKSLESKIGQLFKKQGRRPIINEQINKIKTSHAALIEIQKKELVYEDKQSEMEQMKQVKSQLTTDEAATQAELLKVKKIQTLLPQLHQYQQAERELITLPNNMTFPENGLERLESWKEKILPLTSELQVLEKRIQQDEQKMQEIEEHLYEQDVIKMAKTVVEEQTTYDHLLHQQKEKEAQVEYLEERLDDNLRSVTISMDEIETASFPFHLEKKWEELQRTQEQLLQEGDNQTKLHKELLMKKEQLETEKQALSERQLPEETLQQLKAESHQYNANQQSNTEKDKWQLWEERRTKTAKGLVITGSVIAVIATIIALVMENYLLLTIPFLLVVAGIIQYINIKQTKSYFLQESENNPNDKMTYEQYERKEQTQSEQQSILIEKEAIDKQLNHITTERHFWQNNQAVFLEKENKWIQLMETEHQTYPFLKEVDVQYWTDLLVIIRDIKKILVEKNKLRKDLVLIEQDIQAIDKQILRVSNALNERGVLLTFQQIQDVIEAQQAQQHFLINYEHQVKDHEETIESLEQTILVYEQQMHTLFNYANVDSEEAYVQLAVKVDKKQHLQKEMAAIWQQVATMFTEQEVQALLSETIDEQELTLRYRFLQDKLQQIKQDQLETDKTIATFEMEIEQLELANDHSTAIYKHQMEKDKLQQYANEWATLKIAQSTLAAAKTAYQQSHLVEVMQFTSEFFHEITEGAYSKVHAPTSNELFQVEGKNHIRYTIDKLSQGTIDQLYVSLRLAISVVMSNTYQMPFMIDDGFVHFDQQRTDKMIALLKQLSKEQQLIIFTCKKDIATKLDSVPILQVAKSRGGVI